MLPLMVALFIFAVAVSVPTLISSVPIASTTLNGLKVSGHVLVDTNTGQPVTFHGVNRAGTEYACSQGWGIFDGPSDAASVQAMAAWKVNAVRVPVNEACWLGINGVPAAYAGANYQKAIVDYVNLLHANGMYAELSLLATAPGTQTAALDPQMPDQDHSPAFWASIATTFKGDPLVVFGLLNEPHNVGWACWRDGGAACSLGFAVAGFQELVTTVRNTGATQPISIGCLDYANNCSDASGSWLSYKPTDPLNSLIAEAHIYGKNTCATATCFNQTMAPINAVVPMLWAEIGETYDGSDCNNSSTNVSTFMNWADSHGIGYMAWVWDTWGSCNLSLVTDYAGTPYGVYGNYVRTHLVSLGGLPQPVTNPSPTPSPSPGPSPAPSPSPSPAPSQSPTPSPSPSHSPSPSPSPSSSPSPSPSTSPSPRQSPSPGPVGSAMAGTSSAGFEQDGGNAVKIAVPASTRVGDLLVVAESANQASTSWWAPSGWTFGGGGQQDGQDMNWWWKVASPSEPQTYYFKHSQWADGGMVMLDFAGTSATPVVGVSALGRFNNQGAGNVTQATFGPVNNISAASLLILGWQPISAIPTWPAGFTPVAGATDGFGYVAAAVNTTVAPVTARTVQMNAAQDVVLTLQIAFR